MKFRKQAPLIWRKLPFRKARLNPIRMSAAEMVAVTLAEFKSLIGILDRVCILNREGL